MSAKDVLEEAKKFGLEVRRPSRCGGQWYYRRPGGEWKTAGMTNFRTVDYIRRGILR